MQIKFWVLLLIPIIFPQSLQAMECRLVPSVSFVEHLPLHESQRVPDESDLPTQEIVTDDEQDGPDNYDDDSNIFMEVMAHIVTQASLDGDEETAVNVLRHNRELLTATNTKGLTFLLFAVHTRNLKLVKIL